MDSFGVPKKINRHVIKAIYELADEGSESSDLKNIYNMVKFSTKNNMPVANLMSAVNKSLLNLWKLGVIEKQGTKYCRRPENEASDSRYPPNRVGWRKVKRADLDEEIDTPMNKKRRLFSEDSIRDSQPESSKKHLRRNKPLSRKVRKHTDFQLSHAAHEQDQDSCSNSSIDGNEIKSEDENSANNTFFPTAGQKLQKIGSELFEFDKTYEHSENLLQQLDDSYSHEEQNYKLNKFDDIVVHNQINELDILNENESQSDESKNVSECYKTTYDVKNEPIDVEIKENRTEAMTNHTNVNDE